MVAPSFYWTKCYFCSNAGRHVIFSPASFFCRGRSFLPLVFFFFVVLDLSSSLSIFTYYDLRGRRANVTAVCGLLYAWICNADINWCAIGIVYSLRRDRRTFLSKGAVRVDGNFEMREPRQIWYLEQGPIQTAKPQPPGPPPPDDKPNYPRIVRPNISTLIKVQPPDNKELILSVNALVCSKDVFLLLTRRIYTDVWDGTHHTIVWCGLSGPPTFHLSASNMLWHNQCSPQHGLCGTYSISIPCDSLSFPIYCRKHYCTKYFIDQDTPISFSSTKKSVELPEVGVLAFNSKTSIHMLFPFPGVNRKFQFQDFFSRLRGMYRPYTIAEPVIPRVVGDVVFSLVS